MQQLTVTTDDQAATTERTRAALAGVGAILGAVLGLVIGIAVTAGIAVWAISTAADRGQTVIVDPVIAVHVTASNDVEASSGSGIVVPALVGLVGGGAVGGVVGMALHVRRSRD